MIEILNKIATADSVISLKQNASSLFEEFQKHYFDFLKIKNIEEFEDLNIETRNKDLINQLENIKSECYCSNGLISNLKIIKEKLNENSDAQTILKEFIYCLGEVTHQIQYHPAQPTINMFKEDPSQSITDHVAFISTIDDIKFLSWNVNERNEKSGYCEDDNELPEIKNARFKKIVDALELFVEKNDPDFISLQEISGLIIDEKDEQINEKDKIDHLFPLIMKRLEKGYESIVYDNKNNNKKTADYKEQITLYKKNKFQPSADCKNNYEIDGILGGLCSRFDYSDQNISKKINIANVHAGYKEIPTEHETAIKKWLNENTNTDTLAVVLGDFNCTIAPTDNQTSKMITSSSTKPSMNDRKGQGALAIDGIFYATKSDEKTHYKQGELEQLNPETGKTFHDEELEPIKTKNLHKFQKEQIESFRLAICIDDDINNEKIINNNSISILDYEKDLRKKLNTKSLIVRKAVNLNNIPGIGLSSVSEELNDIFYYLVKNNHNIQCYKNDHRYFSTSLDNTAEFTRVLALVPKLRLLYSNIIKLWEKKHITKECVDAFIYLLQAVADPKEKQRLASNLKVIDFFTKETDKIVKGNKHLTEQDTQKLAKRLDIALYGKPPLSKTVKFIIGGIIGGLLGLVVGAVVFGAMTAWSGGFGALPGALLGAAKGFTLGTAFAVGGASVGAITGGSLGIFSSAKNQKKFTEKSLEKKSKIKDIIEKSEAVIATLKPEV